MILFLDTSDFHALRLALVDPKSKQPVRQSAHAVAYNENHKTAHFLQKFLRRHKTTAQDLTKIVVCTGPGSFTGIRVGVALAQALSFSLNIPLIAKKKNQIPEDLAQLQALSRKGHTVVLNYGKKPNITKSK